MRTLGKEDGFRLPCRCRTLVVGWRLVGGYLVDEAWWKVVEDVWWLVTEERAFGFEN